MGMGGRGCDDREENQKEQLRKELDAVERF
jgi:hypothetical protein